MTEPVKWEGEKVICMSSELFAKLEAERDSMRIALKRFAWLTRPDVVPSTNDLLEIHTTSVALTK